MTMWWLWLPLMTDADKRKYEADGSIPSPEDRVRVFGILGTIVILCVFVLFVIAIFWGS